MNMDTVKAALPGEIGYDEALGPIWPEAKRFYHESMGLVFKLLKDQTFDTIKKDKNSTSEVLKPLNDLHEKIVEEVWTHCCSTSQSQNQFSMTDDTKSKLNSALKFQLQKYKDDLTLLANSIVRPVIGIDLGTTFCCVAVYHEGKVSIVPNSVGQSTTPSYVGFDEGYTFVGQPAKDQANLNPQRTIFDAKRLIGRKFDERIVQEDIKQWPFEVVADDQNNPMIQVEGETYYPEAISAKLLAALREEAESYIGGISIADAVITVPAYFNNGQRHATKEAGKLAGLNVLQILNEPTAAAITYSLHRSEPAKKNVLVFDLGGGTFDVSVLTIEKGSIKILAVGGDTHLGGEDFDSAMVVYCIEQFNKKHGIDLSGGKESADEEVKFKACKTLRRLRDACEKTKTQLSFIPRTSVALDSIHGDKDLNVPITRKILEELIQHHLAKCISTVDAVLSGIPSLTKQDIDEIVLVGGSTRIPKIQQMLVEYFEGKKLSKTIHPDEAVAYGAAVLACLLSQGPGQLEHPIEISDVIPLSLGVLVLEGEFSKIVEKNTTVPCELSKNYRTREDNQTSIWIPIYEGEDKLAKNNHCLGEISLFNIPPAPAGSQKYDIVMKINSEGILSVEATSHGDPDIQQEIKITLTNGRPRHYR